MILIDIIPKAGLGVLAYLDAWILVDDTTTGAGPLLTSVGVVVDGATEAARRSALLERALSLCPKASGVATRVTFHPPALRSPWTIEIPGLHLTNNTNTRAHEMKRASGVHKIRQTVRLFAAGVLQQAVAPLHVIITTVRPRLAVDSDGVHSYGKNVRDELSDMLGYDDRDVAMDHPPITYDVRQRRGAIPSVSLLVFPMQKPPGAVYNKKPSAAGPKVPRVLAENMKRATARGQKGLT